MQNIISYWQNFLRRCSTSAQRCLGKLAPERENILDFNKARDDRVAVASAGPYANNLQLVPDKQPCQRLGQKLFLIPNQQCQSIEGNNKNDNLMQQFLFSIIMTMMIITQISKKKLAHVPTWGQDGMQVYKECAYLMRHRQTMNQTHQQSTAERAAQ